MFCVYVLFMGVYYGIYFVRVLIMDEFDWVVLNGMGSVKVGGNYVFVLWWSDKVWGEGYGIMLYLDSKRYEEVDEFFMSGFIGVLREGGKVMLVVLDSRVVIDSVISLSV